MRFDGYSTQFQQALVLTWANLKTRYRNTYSGLVWVVLNPLLLFGAQAFVFHFLLHINVEKYPLFLLSGLLPWIFVTQSVEMGTGSLVTHGRLLKSFPIHPFVILTSQIVDNLINFFLSFTIVLIPTALYYGFSTIRILLIPLAALPLLIFVVSLVFVLATINVFLWDTRFVATFFMNIAYYLTPIIYPVEMLPPSFRNYVCFNPFFCVLNPFQIAVNGDLSRFGASLILAWVVAVGFTALAFSTWRGLKNEFYYYL